MFIEEIQLNTTSHIKQFIHFRNSITKKHTFILEILEIAFQGNIQDITVTYCVMVIFIYRHQDMYEKLTNVWHVDQH